MPIKVNSPKKNGTSATAPSGATQSGPNGSPGPGNPMGPGNPLGSGNPMGSGNSMGSGIPPMQNNYEKYANQQAGFNTRFDPNTGLPLNPDLVDDGSIQPQTKSKKPWIIGGAIVAVGIVAAVVLKVTVFPSDVKELKQSTIAVAETLAPDESLATPDADSTPTPPPDTIYTQGDVDYSQSEDNKVEIAPGDVNEYTKNLEGKQIPFDYSVVNRRYIKTHVPYIAHRASIDAGMEMFWIDVTYKQKNYRLQVPFYYFKNFDESGVCRVQAEVLDLEDGSQMITYMQVVAEDDGTE